VRREYCSSRLKDSLFANLIYHTSDLCRMKSAATPKQEQYRLQVEEAEDKLVQMTETAIGLMKAVLENVSQGRSTKLLDFVAP
jgi:hypothetical protein